MKRLLLILCITFIATSAFANWFTADSTAIVPKVANDAITVDGMMDEAEWGYVLNSGLGDLWDREDYFATFGMLYDDTNLYFYFQVEDDWLDFQPSTWNTDAVEIYLDGDNSKEDGFDGVDDYQITAVLGAADVNEWVGSGDYLRDNIQWIMTETDLGYDMEIAFPIEDLMITEDFGVDVALNDADDTAARETQVWWAGGVGSSWNTPSDWNNALLGDDIPLDDGMLVIKKAGEAITADGVADEASWEGTMTNIVGSDGTMESYWAKFGMLYDDTNLYLFFSVIDDYLDFQASTWNTDAIEMYFDGDDTKEDNFDGVNDWQVTACLGAADVSEFAGSADYPRDNIQWAMTETELGYDMEFVIPLDDFQIAPPFGFDVALNDADDTGARENQAWWWGGEGISWQTPSDWNTVTFDTESAVENDQPESVPTEFALKQNYPNPFNPSTTIEYALEKAGYTRLAVYDITGSQVTTLVDGYQSAGQHRIQFNALNLASGMYVYELTSGTQIKTRKMTYIR